MLPNLPSSTAHPGPVPLLAQSCNQLSVFVLQLLEAKASVSRTQALHALQLQEAKAQMNNMVPKKQFEQLQTSLREEQCKAQKLQENLHQQAEQTCRQLARTQVSRELQELSQQCQGGSTSSLEGSCGQSHQRFGQKMLYIKHPPGKCT